MNQTFSTQSLQKLFIFPFKDPQWAQKLLVACLLFFLGMAIPIIPTLFLSGYVVRMMRTIINENGAPYLPPWDDWGRYLIDGMKYSVAGIIYSIPVIFLMLIGYGAFMVAGFSPLFLDVSSQEFPTQFLPIMVIMLVVGGAAFFLGMVLAIPLGMVSPAALGHLVAKDNFAAAFHIKEWWPIFRANWTGYVLTILLIWGVTMVLTLTLQLLYLTIILCFLIPFIMSFIFTYIALLSGALYALDYRDGIQKLSQPAPEQASGPASEIQTA